MAATLAQNSTFSFAGATYTVTSVSVEGPQPEIVNMSAKGGPVGQMKMVWTGSYTSPGRVTIDAFGFTDPLTLIGEQGNAVFTTPAGSITRNAICDSASVDAQVGQVLRVRMTFMPTDYIP